MSSNSGCLKYYVSAILFIFYIYFFQIHYMEDGSVEIYSRNMEKNTGKFPDVVATVSR